MCKKLHSIHYLSIPILVPNTSMYSYFLLCECNGIILIEVSGSHVRILYININMIPKFNIIIIKTFSKATTVIIKVYMYLATYVGNIIVQQLNHIDLSVCMICAYMAAAVQKVNVYTATYIMMHIRRTVYRLVYLIHYFKKRFPVRIGSSMNFIAAVIVLIAAAAILIYN